MALVLAKRTSEDAIQVKVQVTEYSMYVPPSLVVPTAAPFLAVIRSIVYSTRTSRREDVTEGAGVGSGGSAGWASWLRGVYLL